LLLFLSVFDQITSFINFDGYPLVI
jgi:hypothetical protein